MLKEDILLLYPEVDEIQLNMRRLRGKMSAPGSAERESEEEEETKSRPYSPLRMFGLELKLMEEEEKGEQRKLNEREGMEMERGRGRSEGYSGDGTVSLTRSQESRLKQVSSSTKMQFVRGRVSFLDGGKAGGGWFSPSLHSLSSLSNPPPTPPPTPHCPPRGSLMEFQMPALYRCLLDVSYTYFCMKYIGLGISFIV